jgi:2-oxoglutarate dehydrogenase E2 component (dihydrolipoamide succinyltransferase)
MEAKIVVPSLGESVVEATVARWLKKEGEPVDAGEALVELETDKVNLEVGAEKAGVLKKIERQEGEDVKVGEVLGLIGDGAERQTVQQPEQASTEPAPAPVPQPASSEPQTAEKATAKATPSARRLAQENNVNLEVIRGSGPGNQITRQDIKSFLDKKNVEPKPERQAAAPAPQPKRMPEPAKVIVPPSGSRTEERVRMSRRRRTIAERLVQAQQTAAMLTTYNEVDMTLIMDVRKRQKDTFKERHGIGLGIVSFFVKASIASLKEFPALNAEIQGDEIVYKHYYDIGIAVGAEEGLVVPVLRDADRMAFAEIEKGIRDFVQKSENGTLTIEDLRGGTFTITNGGVFGSLFSTPILNPPQVAILGLHKIEERPVVVNGQIAVRSMMYVAVSYDHRIVDGRESVQFLARIKQLIEDPSALLLEG